MRFPALALTFVIVAGSASAQSASDDTAPPPEPPTDMMGEFGKPPEKHEELVVYRNLYARMSADVFRPDSRMTLADRSWWAAEYRWETGEIAIPRKDKDLPAIILSVESGIMYEHYRLGETQEHDTVNTAETSIHTVSLRWHYLFEIMQPKMVQGGFGFSAGGAFVFSTYTAQDPTTGLYSDVRRNERVMLYPGAFGTLNYRPVPKIVLSADARINAFIGSTITPVLRLSVGAGFRF